MKKHSLSLLTGFLILALLLPACAAASGSASSANTSTTPVSVGGLTENYTNSLPILVQLEVGTFKLEGSDRAVTAAQASKLLTLWKAMRSLTNSSTAAAAETEALTKQIAGAMTTEQIKAIAAMQLTRQEMMTLAQDQGLAFGPNGNQTPAQQATAQASNSSSSRPQISAGGGPGGGPDGGGAPPSGGVPAGGGDPALGGAPGGAPGAQTTPNARTTGQAGGGAQMTGMFLDAIIKLLETRASQ